MKKLLIVFLAITVALLAFAGWTMPNGTEVPNISLPDPTGSDLWFTFDEAIGSGSATDSVNGVTTTTFKTAFAADGVSGNCVTFQNPGDAIQLGKAAAGASFFNTGFSQRTMTFWFNASSFSGKQMLVEIGGSVSGMAVRINNGALEAAVCSEVVGSVALPQTDVNVWKHVALSFDGGLCNFYLNGELVASTVVSKTQVGDAANPSDIGCNVNGSNAFNDPDKEQNFVGFIDDLRFYTSAVVPTVSEFAPADKSELSAEVTKAKALMEVDYTEDSWQGLKTALDTANEVLNKADATQEEVNKAKEDLVQAMNALVENTVDIQTVPTTEEATTDDATTEAPTEPAQTDPKDGADVGLIVIIVAAVVVVVGAVVFFVLRKKSKK